MFGSHLSIAGGMYNALLKAEELTFDTVQVFTKNQQQWRAKPLEKEVIDRWFEEKNRLKMPSIVSHASYLINLASPDDALWKKSIDLFAEEIRRCAILEIPFLVIHPGAHMGQGEPAGLKRIAAGLDASYAQVDGRSVTTCLEITAGQGSALGYKLEHLAEISQLAKCSAQLGVCLDTAHLFAAGYDFRGPKYDPFMKQVDTIIGLDHVHVLHVNDSKKPLASRVDRHDHIGHGTIGLEGFRPLVRDGRWKQVPKILETPKLKHPSGREWDSVNLEVLRSLQQ